MSELHLMLERTPPLGPEHVLVITAGAIAGARLIDEEIDRDPLGVQKLLRECWRICAADLVAGSVTRQGVMLLTLIGEYFEHSGDWPKAIRCLLEVAGRLDIDHARLHALTDTYVEENRRRFAATFRTPGTGG